MSVGGTKHDNNKAPMDLIPMVALEEIAKVLGFGANLYGRYNWCEGFKYSRLQAATLRHLSQFAQGIDNDEDSGLSHLAHATTCLLMLISHQILGLGEDDRWIKEKKNESKNLKQSQDTTLEPTSEPKTETSQCFCERQVSGE